jgi:hypothetical protein
VDALAAAAGSGQQGIGQRVTGDPPMATTSWP